MEEESVPAAIWMPSHNMTIFRGSPSEMICQIASGSLEGPRPSIPEAIETLLRYVEEERGISVSLPPGISDERRSELMVLVLLDLGIGRTPPTA